MTENTRTLLIVVGVTVVGYLIYKRVNASAGNAARVSPVTSSTTGTGGQQVSGSSGGQSAAGSATFWNSLGSIGRGLNSSVSSVESTYNNVYDLFGGNSS